MKRGLGRFVDKTITIYDLTGTLLINGVLNDASCGFVVVNNQHSHLFPKYAYVCKRKLVLNKLNGVQNHFCVKVGHNIFTPSTSSGFKYWVK